MITALKAESVKDQCQRQSAKKCGGAEVVGVDRALTTGEAELFKVLEAQFSDVADLSTIASWGFSGSDLAIKADIHTLNLGVVNAARVISAGSWSCPGVDHFAANSDAHCVSCIDRLNPVPADGNGLQGISNSDALIEDGDLGMDKEQVVGAQYEGAPRDSDQIAFKSSSRNCFDHKSNDDHSGDASAQPHGARPKEQDVTHFHSVILSQQSGLEGSQS